MLMLFLVFFLFGFVCLTSSAPKVGVRWASCAAFGTLILVPLKVIDLTPQQSDYVVGVAPQNVVVFTFSISILAIFVATWRYGLKPVGIWWLLVLFSYFVMFGAFVWRQQGDTVALVSGMLNAGLAVCAWYVGCSLGKQLVIEENGLDWLSRILFAIGLVVAISVLVQIPSALRGGEWSRVTGTFGHPSMIGKVATVLLLPCLTLAGDPQRAVRIRAFSAIGLLVLATVPTLSRANILALIVCLFVWAIISPSVGMRRRARVLLIVCVSLSLPFVGALVDRFNADPEGGDRPALLEAGWRIVAEWWRTGLGPNLFVPVGSLQEPAVLGTGYPVHNSLLLSVAELGVLGTFLALIPPVVLLFRAIGQLGGTDSGLPRRSGSAFLSVLPGVLTIGTVSWGLLQWPILQLLYLCLGLIGAWMVIQAERGASNDPATFMKTGAP